MGTTAGAPPDRPPPHPAAAHPTTVASAPRGALIEPAPSPRRGVVLPNWEAGSDPTALVEAAVAAEEGGWDGVFLADHLIFPPPSDVGSDDQPFEHAPFPDPWITLGAIAARTRRVTLGSWITPVARRQPWQLARDLATLDRLSGGRVMLGVGLGRRPDHERFGTPWDLRAIARRTDEALELIDALWRGEPVSTDGEHFQVRDAVVLPTPEQQPRIPIVIGGLWPNRAFLRRGARWDGIVPHLPGDGVLPPDDVAVEDHLRALVGAYRHLTETPGEVMVLDTDPPATAHRALCRELGVTWLLTAKHDGRWTLDPELLRQGPREPG